MNPEQFRRLYDYHFAAIRALWDRCIALLPVGQLRHKLPYSAGSVRNQVVHLMNMAERWFCDLRGATVPGILNPVHFGTQAAVRARWDSIEGDMRDYLVGLDESELARPLDKHAAVWQVLFHVLNHGTDHRAQTLGLLAQLGVAGFAQDYYLYLRGRF